MSTTIQGSPATVTVPSLMVRDNNGADTGDRFSLDTKLTVLSIDATGAMLQVSGPNIDGKPTVGFVRKDFVQLDQTPDGPQPPPGSTTPTPGPAPSQGTIDPAIGPALRAALKENEIGNASPYRLSYAKLGQSGASFGVFQGDTHVNPKARSTLLQVLLQSGIASADAESIVNAVSVALPAGSPFSEAVNIQIDTALASSSGRALVDAMDEETFADVEAKLTNCLQIVGSRHATLEAPAQIACTLWINMNGGLTLRKWLGGDVEYGVQPVAAPNVTRGNIETFLKNTDYFVLHPQNFRHFSDSVNAGVGVLPAALNQGQSAFWIYAQSSGKMYHVTNGAPTLIARGYSGNGDGEDNPDEQNVPQHGPIPRGSYSIGGPHVFKNMQDCLTLIPDPGNNMEGRAGFLIHDGRFGGQPHGMTSEGCICLQLPFRQQIWNSGDHRLQVVCDDPPGA